jgi:hypothetical protein
LTFFLLFLKKPLQFEIQVFFSKGGGEKKTWITASTNASTKTQGGRVDRTAQELCAEGFELHVGLDNNTIYCETRPLAEKIKNFLQCSFGIFSSIGKPTEIPSKRNGNIAVIPLMLRDRLQGKSLVIPTSNVLLAMGAEAFFKSPNVHVREIKLIAKKDGFRETNGERRGHRPR